MCECQMKFRRREKAFGDWMDAEEEKRWEEEQERAEEADTLLPEGRVSLPH